MMTEFTALTDLASRALGGGVMAANDEFFAAADALVDPEPPVFTPRTFGAKGQVYDGWETRRRRAPGHDHAIVRLGSPGVIRGLVIDTAHFTGNHPPAASVDACEVDGFPTADELTGWRTVLPRTALRGDHRNLFTVDSARRWTHVRLSIHPDGGVARLRVHGEAVPDRRFWVDTALDLAAAGNGGRVVGSSDRFYGNPANLLLPGLAATMGEGWETRRRRGPGNDWVVVRLAVPGVISVVELDTSHFKGNAPTAAALSGVDTGGAAGAGAADAVDAVDSEASWFEILPRTRLLPDTPHRFLVSPHPAATHVRLDIFPDGGLSRLRLPGHPT